MDFNKSGSFLGMSFDVFDRKIVDALPEQNLLESESSNRLARAKMKVSQAFPTWC